MVAAVVGGSGSVDGGFCEASGGEGAGAWMAAAVVMVVGVVLIEVGMLFGGCHQGR